MLIIQNGGCDDSDFDVWLTTKFSCLVKSNRGS